MAKKLTKEEWRERHKIFNPHNIASASSGIFIYFRTKMSGRAYRSAAWQVCQIGKQTDPTGHWMDNGDKTFPFPFMMTKEQALEEAKKFCLEKFGIASWERDPWGSWHPMGDMAKAAEKKL